MAIDKYITELSSDELSAIVRKHLPNVSAHYIGAGIGGALPVSQLEGLLDKMREKQVFEKSLYTIRHYKSKDDWTQKNALIAHVEDRGADEMFFIKFHADNSAGANYKGKLIRSVNEVKKEKKECNEYMQLVLDGITLNTEYNPDKEAYHPETD